MHTNIFIRQFQTISGMDVLLSQIQIIQKLIYETLSLTLSVKILLLFDYMISSFNFRKGNRWYNHRKVLLS